MSDLQCFPDVYCHVYCHVYCMFTVCLLYVYCHVKAAMRLRVAFLVQHVSAAFRDVAAMPAVQSKPRRLWKKTTVQQAGLEVEVGPEEVKLKQVYLITLAHRIEGFSAEGILLVAPGTYCYEQIARKGRGQGHGEMQ